MAVQRLCSDFEQQFVLKQFLVELVQQFQSKLLFQLEFVVQSKFLIQLEFLFLFIEKFFFIHEFVIEPQFLIIEFVAIEFILTFKRFPELIIQFVTI